MIRTSYVNLCKPNKLYNMHYTVSVQTLQKFVFRQNPGYNIFDIYYTSNWHKTKTKTNINQINTFYLVYIYLHLTLFQKLKIWGWNIVHISCGFMSLLFIIFDNIHVMKRFAWSFINNLEKKFMPINNQNHSFSYNIKT